MRESSQGVSDLVRGQPGVTVGVQCCSLPDHSSIRDWALLCATYSPLGVSLSFMGHNSWSLPFRRLFRLPVPDGTRQGQSAIADPGRPGVLSV